MKKAQPTIHLYAQFSQKLENQLFMCKVFFIFLKQKSVIYRGVNKKKISLNREGSFKKVLVLRTKSIRGEGFLTLCENYSLLSSDLPSLKRSNHCILHLSSTWREQCQFQLRMSFKYISTLQYMLQLEIPCDKMGNTHVISPAFQSMIIIQRKSLWATEF